MPPATLIARRAATSRSPARAIVVSPPKVNPTNPALLRTQVVRRPSVPPSLRPAIVSKPPPVLTLAVTQQAAGFYRVADPTLDQYEIYIAAGVDIDFTAPPAMTTTSLPLTFFATGTYSGTDRICVRRRNAWNLLSQNSTPTIFRTDGTPAPPSAPSFSASPAAAGTIAVTSEYFPTLDGANAGDTFLLWLTTTGSDPDPGTTPTATFAFTNADGTAKYDPTFGPYAEGTTVKILVRIRRSGSPNIDSTNTTPVSAIATLLGPAAPTGVASIGEVAE